MRGALKPGQEKFFALHCKPYSANSFAFCACSLLMYFLVMRFDADFRRSPKISGTTFNDVPVPAFRFNHIFAPKR